MALNWHLTNMYINKDSWHYRFTAYFQNKFDMNTKIRHVNNLCSYIRQFMFVLVIGWPFVIAVGTFISFAVLGCVGFLFSPVINLLMGGWDTVVFMDAVGLMVAGVIDIFILACFWAFYRSELKRIERDAKWEAYGRGEITAEDLKDKPKQPNVIVQAYRDWADKHCTLVTFDNEVQNP